MEEMSSMPAKCLEVEEEKETNNNNKKQHKGSTQTERGGKGFASMPEVG